MDLSQRADVAPTFQRRSYDLVDFEFRDDGPTGFTFEGIASKVDVPYEVRDQFGSYEETIAAGAFDHTLKDKKANVALFVNHGWQWGQIPLAARAAQTLTLTADPHLRVRAHLDPSRPDVQIVRSAVTRGELPQMSVGFNAVKARDKWAPDWSAVTRTQVSLQEVSIVDQGANPHTSASVRSVDEFLSSLTDLDMDEADVRRALSALEARLPEPVPAPVVDYSNLVALWQKRRQSA